MPETLIVQRKSEHLRIVAEEDVAHGGSTLLENIRLIHQALPELDHDELDLSVPFFGKELKLPMMITSMTGGADYAKKMNQGLAEVASTHGIAFAVGSQRVMLRHPETVKDFAVREFIPDGVLLGNIGGVQLCEYDTETISGLIHAIDADGICVHLNAGQELVQDEGQRRFRGILDCIARLVDELDGRVLVKETGAGMSPRTLASLNSIGVKVIDVAGAGGTSWTKVEKYRAPSELLQNVGETFQDWGLPTAFSLLAARRNLASDATIIASGGILNGLDMAKAFAAGAHVAGFARVILNSFYHGGVDAASALIDLFRQELATAMILTGSGTIQALRNTPFVVTGELKDYLRAFGWNDGDVH